MHELNGGDSCSITIAPLRVTLTGVLPDTGVEMKIMEDGAPANVIWQSSIEAVLLPGNRKFTVLAQGQNGALIPPDTVVGLSIRPDVGTDAEQVFIISSDIGAKLDVELAEVDFQADSVVVLAPQRVTTSGTSGSDGWTRPGAYAFREAFINAQPGSAFPWVFVVDGSVSMVLRLKNPESVRALPLVAGVAQEWLHRGPKAVFITNAHGVEIIDSDIDFPSTVSQRVQENPTPASWLHLAPVIEAASLQLGSGGIVVAVVDGLPADIDETVAALKAHPNIGLRLVTWGNSKLGLPSQTKPEWYADDLALGTSLSECSVIVSLPPDDLEFSNVELAQELAGLYEARSLL